jgi:PAS domain S-box-containing protein
VSKPKREGELPQAVEDKFGDLAGGAGDLVWQVDDKGVYTYVSPDVRNILGYEATQLLGRKPIDFVPPEAAAAASSLCSRIVAAREPFQALKKVTLHRDGRHVILETSGAPLFDAEGHFRGYRGVDRDVTQRRRRDEWIRRSRALETAIGVPAGVAHDVNNLLTVIAGYSDLALSRFVKDDPVVHEIEEIKAAAGRAISLLSGAPAPKVEPAGGGETILLVEDQEAVRKLVYRTLSLQGYRVLQAADGQEALDLAEQSQGPIHLLVTDVVMPRIGGAQLVRRLAAKRPGLKVLFVSGFPADELGPHGILDDDANFLKKPFSPDSLAQKVRTLLDG